MIEIQESLRRAQRISLRVEALLVEIRRHTDHGFESDWTDIALRFEEIGNLATEGAANAWAVAGEQQATWEQQS
jgi:hypothetical protein